MFLDPNWVSFIKSNLVPHYHALLKVAQFVATVISTQLLSDTLIPAALSLMKIEYWILDIAQECKKALQDNDNSLPPLVCYNDMD